jgi:outer membrane protein assembly factor BamB
MKTRTAGSILSVSLALIIAACGSTPITPSPTGTTTGTDLVSTATATPIATPVTSQSPSSAPTGDTATADWPVYHLDSQRTGNATAFPAFTGSLTKAWTAGLDGAVYAEPLVVGGQVIAATEGDSVYALDPSSGKALWHQELGTPVAMSTLPCGNIDPLGITSTPAYDATTATLFAVAEVKGPAHTLFALDPTTGSVRWSRNVDLPGHPARNQQQRAALAVGNGYVYIGFGGLAGDCAQYSGEVVGVPVSGQGDTISYTVPVAREGAVWATGGPVIDESGNLYVSTGNGSSTSKYDGSDSVVELSPKLQMISRFAPFNWASDNARDLDLGSLAPVLVPGGYVFIAGKRGTGYVLRQGALGGIGKQVSSATVCGAFGGSAQIGGTIFVPCTSQLRQVTVGTDGSLHPGWTNSSAGGPPVVGGGVVWSLASDHLYALDPTTGATRASMAVGSLPHFASPTLWNGLVLVGTMSGVFAVKL